MMEIIIDLVEIGVLWYGIIIGGALFISSLPKLSKRFFNAMYRFILKSKSRSIRRANPSGYYRNI